MNMNHWTECLNILKYTALQYFFYNQFKCKPVACTQPE